MRTTHLAALVAASVLTLGIAGCTGNPIENVIEGVIKDQTGIEVEAGTVGESASVPANWPGQPVPAGKIISTLAVDKTFSLTILVESEEEIERIIAELLAQGYGETGRVDYGDFDTVVMASEDWTATFSWYPDEESGRVGLIYGVTPTGG